jgi:hypothetical protein
MKYRSFVGLLTALVTLIGCARDLALAPPVDTDHVKVAVKLPNQIVAETMQVIYRSTLCTFTDHNANGRSYQRDGYQNMDVALVRVGQSDLYEAKLARDGGGDCQWRLSNVTFGVVYSDPSRFGQGVTYGGGGEIVVIFDSNNSPRGGADIEVEGRLVIKKYYYPWVDEEFLGLYKKTVSFASESYTYRVYKASEASVVTFEIILHPDFVLYSVGPRVKKKGNHTVYTYPDGSVYADGLWHPNFLRLQTIRLKAEGKQ